MIYFPFSDYWLFYLGFTVFVLVILALDLGVFHRKAHEIKIKEATIWTSVWISLAFVFNFLFYLYARYQFSTNERYLSIPDFDPAAQAKTSALEFLTGFIIEKSLAIDNIFVFVVVFSYFGIPKIYQHLVLFWGILGALAFRIIFIALGSVLLISFLLIYLIMVALYDSFVYPFVVLFSIPVAAIGAFLALNLSLNNLSLFALLGLIMLMGLVVKNAILIVDFTNQLKAQGKHYKEALIIAGKGRMRPILMTTIAMIMGMLPIALGKGTASEWKNGLAWVIIGGLFSSLVLTVYLVPMVYYLVDLLKEKLKTKKSN